MGLLRKDTFICLDCEATGLSVEEDEIIEVAVARFTFDEVVESFDTLIDPHRPIPEESTKVHHITNAMVQGKPKIEDVLAKVFKMVGKHLVVGHNIGFDLRMLSNAARKRNLPCPIDLEKSIDTLRLARLYAESPTNSLEDLRKHFNIEEEGAHRAMNDVIVNIKVFKYLALNFKRTEDVIKRLRQPILMKLMPLGKHKGRPFHEVPIDYLHWASHQDFDEDLLFTINEERRRRRIQKPFSQMCNPFSEL
jgi:DNA polymerase-3 subunit epsilon